MPFVNLRSPSKRAFCLGDEPRFRRAAHKAARYGQLGGWAISRFALRAVAKEIEQRTVENVLEFGPGSSTVFLDNYLEPQCKIWCFEHQTQYAESVERATSARCNVMQRELVQFDNASFNAIMSGVPLSDRRLNRVPVAQADYSKTRMPNLFYDLRDFSAVERMDDALDLVIVDGPNGSGRSIAYSLMRDHVRSGTLVLIDDCNHYPFVQQFYRMFDANVVASVVHENDSWLLFEITGVRTDDDAVRTSQSNSV